MAVTPSGRANVQAKAGGSTVVEDVWCGGLETERVGERQHGLSSRVEGIFGIGAAQGHP